ncbi:transcription factor MYB64-like [Telopea speciosissima]|uniref:transcription factor MYB64-like n=1 Tax=Telopea speciosissima TaxID=54955 RepID=UPI001CC4F528|nr:transcription factor MYB64-like [Telopea speciosissima]
MEGGAGIRYSIPAKNPHLARSTRPLTALGRFLCSPNDLSQKQIERSVSQIETVGFPNVFGFPSSSSSSACPAPVGAIDGYPSGVSSQTLQDISFVDGLFLDGGSINMTQEWNHNMGLREVTLEEKNEAELGKKGKRGASANWIKGQWTDEEDRLLVRLVKQYGVRKWAQIAQKLGGRVGKQCRERWHNHLRPNIKKDTWSEEEERVLVESHKKVGNKWAEIAKQISGRTENAIKNHWNATKRRQNSRRKIKNAVFHAGKSHPSILEDYIRSKIMKDTNCITTTTTITPTTGSSVSIVPSKQCNLILPEPTKFSLKDISSTSDNELLFIQQVFEESLNDEELEEFINFNPLELCEIENNQPIIEMGQYGFSATNITPRTTTVENVENTSTSQYLSSDLYLSYLLNGESTCSSSVAENFQCEYSNNDLLLLLNTDESSSNGKKDIDLIEMVSSSQYMPRAINAIVDALARRALSLASRTVWLLPDACLSDAHIQDGRSVSCSSE